ncbi:MAG: PadR family transcriptional regulator [Sphingomonas sp.]|nr:PadR family transcriptional regulator [Sphingomonas sp.]
MARRPHSSRQALSLMEALIARPEMWRHGYDLLQETQLKSGTLYPLLMRLADDGLLEAEWRAPVPPARAPRHAYRLTPSGRAFARAMLAHPNTNKHGLVGATA